MSLVCLTVCLFVYVFVCMSQFFHQQTSTLAYPIPYLYTSYYNCIILNLKIIADCFLNKLIKVQNFNSQAWIEVCQEHNNVEVIHSGHWWSLTGYFEDVFTIDVMYRSNMWFMSYVPIFSSRAWIKVGQGQPVHKVLLKECLWFLIVYKKNWDNFWHHGSP